MTSSLVGSEMCIRDSKRSFWQMQACPQTSRQKTDATFRVCRLDEEGELSVSYTHLTLPTICSV
eukprot:9305622-Prorocentrum_lima.AAC.1